MGWRAPRLMKLYLKFLVCILVIGLAAPFFLKRADGRPWMDAGQLLPDLAAWRQALQPYWRALTETGASDAAEVAVPAGSQRVYKWRAADGSWNYSDQRPDASLDTEVQSVIVNPDTNLIKGIELPSRSQNQTENSVAAPPDGLPYPLSVQPSQIKTLLEDAREVRQQSEQRQELLEKI